MHFAIENAKKVGRSPLSYTEAIITELNYKKKFMNILFGIQFAVILDGALQKHNFKHFKRIVAPCPV